MLGSQLQTLPRTPSTTNGDSDRDREAEHFRDIHALTPPPPPPRGRWETSSSHLSPSMSVTSELGGSNEHFASLSRDFNALLLAGSAIGSSVHNNIGSSLDINNNDQGTTFGSSSLLSRIGENDGDHDDVPHEETNPLAIVPDSNPLHDPNPRSMRVGSGPPDGGGGGGGGELSVQTVKKEEVETKICAWQNAKIAKINNRFKREDAIINGWESEQAQKAASWMKKVERKLEEKRARAFEKMQNEVAKAHRKAEERKATSEAKRGTKVARVLETANLMRAVGRAPVKRSFF